MIDKVPNRYASCDFTDTAVMVTVPVRDHQVINLTNTCVANGRHDSIGVACSANEISGINKQRLTGWRHEQRGIATFYINDVGIQSLARAGLTSQEHRSCGHRDNQNESTHCAPL